MNRRMETDERIFCIGEDIHKLRGGVNGATEGLAQRFPDRIVPTPIAELGFSGLAGGVASEGTYRPVVELMYPDFSLVAADQLFDPIAKARHMFGGETHAVGAADEMASAAATGRGASWTRRGSTATGRAGEWSAPSTPFDYVGLIKNSALLCEDPVLMIEHVDLYATTGIGPGEDLDYFIPFGKAKIARQGTLLTVLTYLPMVPLAKRVAEEMGIDAEIVDLRSLDRAGLDWETIGASIRKSTTMWWCWSKGRSRSATALCWRTKCSAATWIGWISR